MCSRCIATLRRPWGGEQRRVQFARVLAQIEAARTVHDRQALLLDEPVANLDPPISSPCSTRRKEPWRAALRCSRSCTTSLAARYADMLALMNDGAIVACGEPASVQTSRLLSGVFAIDLAVGTTLTSESPLVMPSRWLIGG